MDKAETDDKNTSLTSTEEHPSGLSIEVRGTSTTNGVMKHNQVSTVMLHGVSIVCLFIDGKERLCLAQISNTLLKSYSYNEIHNRRVALGITCVQCTPVQLEILRRAGAMPISSRRCGMITKREAERLVKSFLEETEPPKLPDNFSFDVSHNCGWGCRGHFTPSRYNSSRAKCIKCFYCNMFFSPNKFIFHFHRVPSAKYNHPDAANFNSWRRHLRLTDPEAKDELQHAWEDVKAMFNGGSRKRVLTPQSHSHNHENQDLELNKRSKLHGTHGHSIQNQSQYPYPVFPVPNKALPLKRLPGHPMFTVPYSTHENRISPCHEPVSQSPPSPWPNPQDPFYPPYEIIWAKHLGLVGENKGYVGEAERMRIVSSDLGSGSTDLKEISSRSGSPGNVTESSAGRPIGGKNLSLCVHEDGKAPRVSAFKPFIVKNYDTGNYYQHNSDIDASKELPNLDEQCESDGEIQVDVDTIDDFNEEFDRAEQTDSSVQNVDSSVQTDFCSKKETHSHHEYDERVPKEITEDDCHDDAKCDNVDTVASSEVPSKNIPSLCVAEVYEQKTHEANPEEVYNHERIKQINSDSHLVNTREKTSEQHKDNGEVGHVTISDSSSESENFKLKNMQKLTKEELQEELIHQMDVRKKLESDCKIIRDTFQEQVKRELSYREEMSQQLQIVRETLCHELEQERKARYSLQQKLKEAHDALHSFSCKMLAPRQCSECTYKEAVLPR